MSLLYENSQSSISTTFHLCVSSRLLSHSIVTPDRELFLMRVLISLTHFGFESSIQLSRNFSINHPSILIFALLENLNIVEKLVNAEELKIIIGILEVSRSTLLSSSESLSFSDTSSLCFALIISPLSPRPVQNLLCTSGLFSKSIVENTHSLLSKLVADRNWSGFKVFSTVQSLNSIWMDSFDQI